MSYQAREMRGFLEKAAVTETLSFANSILASGKVCSFEINNLSPNTINLSTPPDVAHASFTFSSLHTSDDPLSPLFLKVGQVASPNASSLVVQSIQLKEFEGSGQNYVANWVIEFDNEKVIRPVKPIRIKTRLIFDMANPALAKIKSCAGMGLTQKPLFKIESIVQSFYAGGGPLGTCHGISTSPPGTTIAAPFCLPYSCPTGSDQLQLYINNKGAFSWFYSGSVHGGSEVVQGQVRICESQKYTEIITVSATGCPIGFDLIVAYPNAAIGWNIFTLGQESVCGR